MGGGDINAGGRWAGWRTGGKDTEQGQVVVRTVVDDAEDAAVGGDVDGNAGKVAPIRTEALLANGSDSSCYTGKEEGAVCSRIKKKWRGGQTRSIGADAIVARPKNTGAGIDKPATEV